MTFSLKCRSFCEGRIFLSEENSSRSGQLLANLLFWLGRWRRRPPPHLRPSTSHSSASTPTLWSVAQWNRLLCRLVGRNDRVR